MKRSILNRQLCNFIVDATGPMKLHLVGKSMEPTILGGRFVYVSKIASVRPGRCYLFRYNNKLLVHRLVAMKNDTVFFWGDNGRTIEKTSIDSVLGEIAERHSLLFFLGIVILNYICYAFFSNDKTVPGCCMLIRSWGIMVLLSFDTLRLRSSADIPALLSTKE